MSRTLIIGIGNPLRGDDGLGWRAVEELSRLPVAEDAQTLLCHQLTPELAEAVAQSDRVVFVDACVGSPPGKIRVRRLTSESETGSALTHLFDPPGLMQYSRRLYGSTPEGLSVSMTGSEYGYSDELSPVVQAKLVPLMDLVTRLVLRIPVACAP